MAGGVVDTIQRIYILATTYIQGAVEEILPGMEEPGGVGGVSASWGGVRAELCGANNKRDTTPEGWLFLKLLFEGQ